MKRMLLWITLLMLLAISGFGQVSFNSGGTLDGTKSYIPSMDSTRSNTVNLSSGYVICQGTEVNYQAGTVQIVDDSTNYIYLDTANNCAPTVSQTAFPSTGIPIAKVQKVGNVVTNALDVRGSIPSGTGGGAAAQGTVNQIQINNGATPAQLAASTVTADQSGNVNIPGTLNVVGATTLTNGYATDGSTVQYKFAKLNSLNQMVLATTGDSKNLSATIESKPGTGNFGYFMRAGDEGTCVVGTGGSTVQHYFGVEESTGDCVDTGVAFGGDLSAYGGMVCGLFGETKTAGQNAAIKFEGCHFFKPPHCAEFVIDGGGSAIGTGVLAVFPTSKFPTWTITNVSATADQAGSFSLDIWKKAATAGCSPTSCTINKPSAADKISGTNYQILNGVDSNNDSTLSGWTNTTVNYGDTWGGTITASATVQRVTVQVCGQ